MTLLSFTPSQLPEYQQHHANPTQLITVQFLILFKYFMFHLFLFFKLIPFLNAYINHTSPITLTNAMLNMVL
jgi:hypothetical protein